MALAVLVLTVLVLFGMACTFLAMKKRFANAIFALSALASASAGIIQLAEADNTLPWVLGWVLLMIGFVSITLSIVSANQIADEDYEEEYQAWLKERQDEDRELEETINRRATTRIRSRLSRMR